MKSQSKNIRIYGAGGHSRVLNELLRENGQKITSIFENKPKINIKTAEGGVIQIRKKIEEFPNEGYPVIIAIGSNIERANIAKTLYCKYGNAFHKTSYIASSVNIGIGSVVFAGAVIQSNTTIGKHVIVNTSASIDHDCIIEDFAHISPNATLCGHVTIGEGTQVGAGSVIIQTVKVGKWCTIGAGAVILKDVPDNSTIVGNPGRIIKREGSKGYNLQNQEEYNLLVE